MKDVAIIRPDPRGFYHLELYTKASKWTKAVWADAPDMTAFARTQMHATEEQALARARELWPDATLRVEKAAP